MRDPTFVKLKPPVVATTITKPGKTVRDDFLRCSFQDGIQFSGLPV
jgi:hypothetical protein